MITGACLAVLCVFLAKVEISHQQQVFQIELPQNQTLAVGQSATFQVVVFANINGDGVWYKDGVQISAIANVRLIFSSGSTRQLILTSVQESDAGVYTISIGGRNSSSTLFVQNISILTTLTSQTVVVGQTVTFQTTLSHSNIQNGQWFKDGSPVVTDTRVQTFVSATQQTLSISSAVTTDSGQYEYRVNSLSTTATLTVVTQQTISILSNLQNTTVNVGQSASFSILVSTSNVVVGSWRRGGAVQNLVNSAKTQISAAGQFQQLTITDAQTSDAGQYIYIVDGQTNSAYLNVLVPTGLAIVTGLPDLTVNIGTTAVFQLRLNQNDITNGVWRKGQTVITNTANRQISVSGTLQSLLLSNVQPADAGTYTYTVNGLTSSGNLNVVQVTVVNGNWGPWNVVTDPPCGITCGTTFNVFQSRTRFCNNPAPSNGGASCPGSSTDQLQKTCSFASCPVTVVNGNWGPWNVVTDPPCGITCGTTFNVFQSRTRFCNNPAPSNGGASCPGSSTDQVQKTCSFASCPAVVNGNWGAWITISDPSCGITCGSTNNVFRNRTRFCNNPAPSNGGASCPGSSTSLQEKSCVFNNCPVVVNGNWGAWITISDPSCGITCGTTNNVFRNRTRFCDNPAPSNGGASCPGSSTSLEAKSCVFNNCPVVVNGNWGAWITISDPSCGITCGTTNNVFRNRTRFCNNPAPSNGGASCPGSSTSLEAKSCVFNSCPVAVNGNWGAWITISDPSCGITCGSTNNVFQNRTRFCNNPAPSNGGATCPGSSTSLQAKSCVFNSCPVNGNWGPWVLITDPPCGITCGTTNSVFRNRTRLCNNPAPSNGGTSCPGTSTDLQQKTCSFASCPAVVNGNWGAWITINDPSCGITCGTTNSVFRNRTRFCNNPVPSGGGASCPGSSTSLEVKTCVFNSCPVVVNGNWGTWVLVSDPPCGITCGTINSVFRNRTRLCNNPPPSNGGQTCQGSSTDLLQKTCSFASCPVAVNGNWGAWITTSDPSCAITCGQTNSVFQSRLRFCNNPPASNGGLSCPGSNTDLVQKTCAFPACPVPVNGNWGAWITISDPSCGITCGSINNVFRNRTRFCNSPAPSNGGASCPGSSTSLQEKSCVFNSCPVVVNGNWGAWVLVSDPPCGITCGTTNSVFRNRTRLCNNPAPSNGGASCPGSSTDRQQKTCSFATCAINGNWGVWAAWSDPPCGITCGTTNNVFRNRTRLCNNPAPSNGGVNCPGPSTDSTQKTCVFPACAVDLCSNARVVNNVGYRYHPTDCDKYIQCYYNPNGNIVAVHRRCPFSYFWNQVTLRCDEAWKVNCPIERCKDNCTGTYNMLGSCRSYWECDRNSVSVAKCCAMGFSFVEGRGCTPNFFCRDVCPTACADRDVCDKYPDWTNANAYNISVGLLGWQRARCVSGTFFDITECGCSARNTSCQPSYDLTFTPGASLTNALSSWLTLTRVPYSNGIASFNGDGQLVADFTLPSASRNCPKIVRFRYRESSGVSGRRVLLSTGDCLRNNSLVIAVDDTTMMFELTSWYGWTVKLPLAMTGMSRSEWKTVTLLYSGYDMLAVVESATMKYTTKVHATQSTIMACGLRFGTDGFTTATNFRGQLDQLTVYRCNPGGLY